MKRRLLFAACGFALATLFLLPACGSKGNADPNALTGVEWTLVESSMSSADLGAAGITATFEGKQVGGSSGVNRYGGPYTAGRDGSFKAGPLSSTMMAGPEPLMKAEQAYLALLPQCTRFQIANGRLTLSTGAQETLVFEHAGAAQLPGTTWDVTASAGRMWVEYGVTLTVR